MVVLNLIDSSGNRPLALPTSYGSYSSRSASCRLNLQRAPKAPLRGHVCVSPPSSSQPHTCINAYSRHCHHLEPFSRLLFGSFNISQSSLLAHMTANSLRDFTTALVEQVQDQSCHVGHVQDPDMKADLQGHLEFARYQPMVRVHTFIRQPSGSA
jgi:hypothetical protein